MNQNHYHQQYDQYQNNFYSGQQYSENLQSAYAQQHPVPYMPMEKLPAVQTPKEIIETKLEEDSPLLRKLLNGKSKSRPSYGSELPAKRQKINEPIEIISPLRTEDSSDYFDDYTHTVKQHGIVIGMTSENSIAASSLTTTPLSNHSPITYIEGINTPPSSPKEEAIEGVNQNRQNYDGSLATDNAWIQNGSECKFSIFSTFCFIYFFAVVFEVFT